MTLTEIKDWVWIVNVAGAILLVIAVQYLRGIFAAKDRVEIIDRLLSNQEIRLQLIESKIDDVSLLKDQFHALHGDMKALTAELHGLKEVFSGTQHILNMMHRHLLKSEK